MLIGIEAERANCGQKTGVEHYAKQLILHLAKIDRKNRYVLYLRSRPQDWLLRLPENFQVKVMPFPFFWTQLRLSWEMLCHPPDALFIPASALPFIHPPKAFVTIHDLAWKYYPETFTSFNRRFLNWSTGFALKRAREVIAVSQSTKDDLCRHFQVAEDKVKVVHHGYDPAIGLSQGQKKPAQKLPEKYFLFLSTLQPRKNLEGLVSALRELKKHSPELPHKLVVVGKPGWKFGPILERIRQNPDLVVYLSHLEDEERNYVLKNAEALVLPSFYEGFGMTILEAFAAGVPVATAAVSSMPEVAGPAALYFNPHDVSGMEAALRELATNPRKSEELVRLGKARLEAFSWDKCAQETLAVITRR